MQGHQTRLEEHYWWQAYQIKFWLWCINCDYSLRILLLVCILCCLIHHGKLWLQSTDVAFSVYFMLCHWSWK